MTNSSTKKRRPRLQRVSVDELPPLRLTKRDTDMTIAVYEYRVLTTHQIERLLFASDSKHNRCRSRLQALFQHGYLYRVEQKVAPSEATKPLLYMLDEKGARLIQGLLDLEEGELDWKPSDKKLGDLFLEHLIATQDVRIAVTLSARKHNTPVVVWLDEATLRSNQMKEYVTLIGPNGEEDRGPLVPDGYFVVQFPDGRRAHHFLEIDRGTMTAEASQWARRDWGKKILRYIEYHQSGAYQKRYGSKSMRVLTVTTTLERLKTLKQRTENVGGEHRFFFTTFELIQENDPFTSHIWQVATLEGTHPLFSPEMLGE
jgi:hypothetical protein